MAIKTTNSPEYGASKQILVFPDHYVATAQYINGSSTGPNKDLFVTTDAGKTVLPAGTIYPANDETAKGVVLSDYEIKDENDVNVALVIHGFIDADKMPETSKPTEEAIAALNLIKFVGYTPTASV